MRRCFVKDLVTFGETMVLFNPDSDGPLRYVHGFKKSIAGAESNVAIALARLGHDVGWFSRIGDDEFGQFIKHVIRGEGVDVSKVSVDLVNPTGILFKERFMHTEPSVYYYRRQSAASHMTSHDVDYDYIKNAKILHISGITLALSESCRESVYKAIDIAKKENTMISFDPNIRQKLWSIDEARPVILDVARHADIILPGLDEADLLIGKTSIEDIVDYFHGLGNKIVALKLGKKGCFVSNGEIGLEVPGFKVEQAKDTVGAGDGFAAGFLSGVLQEQSLYDCGRLANAIGAMATLVKGDMEGYPTKRQVRMFMGEDHYIDR